MGLSACHSAHKIAVPELLWELRRVSHQKLAALGHIQVKSLKLSSPKSASSSARKLGTKSLEGSVFVKGKGWLNTLYIYCLFWLNLHCSMSSPQLRMETIPLLLTRCVRQKKKRQNIDEEKRYRCPELSFHSTGDECLVLRRGGARMRSGWPMEASEAGTGENKERCGILSKRPFCSFCVCSVCPN